MISRMILVGLVAVLGVSLPSRSESGGWLNSAHEWVVTQLAEWDTYTPGDECCVIVTELPNPLLRGATPAVGDTNTTAPVAFDPIPVADDRDNRIADELNRFAEGLDLPATSTAVVEPPSDFVAVSSCDSVELKLAIELRQMAEASERDEKDHSPATPGPREADADPAIDELFAHGSEVFAPAEPGLATFLQPEAAPIATRSSFEPIRPLMDSESDVAMELNRFAEGIEIRPEDVPPRLARAQAFEPIEVPADLESGIAYELNRASEGLELRLAEVRRSVEAQAQPRIPPSEPAAPHLEGKHNPGKASIGKALSLTRDAALAWMNVLTGTTPVMTASQ